MARIAGIDLPRNKRAEVSIQYIYGIGPALAKIILERAGVDPGKQIKDLAESEIVAIREVIKDYKVEGDLRKEVSLNIKRLIDIGAYRGIRHRRNLPVKGQRTRTNARTKRGKRKTVGAGKKKEEAKPAKE
ncbi:MAG: 30S ribosomal protein S13 [Candidatus Saganbacteria bacterium]|nr:30S ribosomal protein S13 [Candidatus Saganbacteria bacterium]